VTAVEPAIGVLSTLALLKANFDESRDHIAMFLPFVLDAVSRNGSDGFVTEDIVAKLSTTFRFEIPIPTVKTILGRAVSKGYLRREFGRYWINEGKLPDTDLLVRAAAIRDSHLELAARFRAFCDGQGYAIADDSTALRAILDFLDRNHVAMLLDD